jgi:hypothetical protein
MAQAKIQIQILIFNLQIKFLQYRKFIIQKDRRALLVVAERDKKNIETNK